MCPFNPEPPKCPIPAATAAPQRNIKPMTRLERRALKDKVALEKGRLMQVRVEEVQQYMLLVGTAVSQ